MHVYTAAIFNIVLPENMYLYSIIINLSYLHTIKVCFNVN